MLFDRYRAALDDLDVPPKLGTLFLEAIEIGDEDLPRLMAAVAEAADDAVDAQDLRFLPDLDFGVDLDNAEVGLNAPGVVIAGAITAMLKLEGLGSCDRNAPADD